MSFAKSLSKFACIALVLLGTAARGASVSYTAEFEMADAADDCTSFEAMHLYMQDEPAVPQFNPALGTLTAVKVEVKEQALAFGWSVWGTPYGGDGAGGGVQIEIYDGTQKIWDWGDGVQSQWQHNVDDTYSYAVGMLRGIDDDETTAPALTRFIGTGTVSLLVKCESFADFMPPDPGWPVGAEGSTNGEYLGEIKVTYTYTP